MISEEEIRRKVGESERISVVKSKGQVMIARSGSRHGYHYVFLAHNFSPRRMDPYLMTRPPRQEKKPARLKHQGHELIFMLQGDMESFHGGAVPAGGGGLSLLRRQLRALRQQPGRGRREIPDGDLQPGPGRLRGCPRRYF